MAFALNANSIPCIRSYGAALEKWTNAPEFTPGVGYMRDGSRPLGPHRSKSHLVIRRDSNGDIALRYHDTDCVVYQAGGNIEIRGYDSQSTNTFINQLTPDGVLVCCTDKAFEKVLYLQDKPQDGPYRWDDHLRAYRFGSRITIAQEGDYWKPLPETYPIEYPVFDAALSRKVLKEIGFHDFKHWYYARAALLKPRAEPVSERDPDANDIAGWLKDVAYWDVLARVQFPDTRSEGAAWGRQRPDNSPKNLRRLFIENVRQRMLHHYGAIKVETAMSLSYKELNKARVGINKTKWLFT